MTKILKNWSFKNPCTLRYMFAAYTQGYHIAGAETFLLASYKFAYTETGCICGQLHINMHIHIQTGYGGYALICQVKGKNSGVGFTIYAYVQCNSMYLWYRNFRILGLLCVPVLSSNISRNIWGYFL